MALVAIVTAGLIGGGIAGVSQFAEADRPDLAAQVIGDTSDSTLPPVDDTVPPVDEGDDSDEPPRPDEPEIDGQITIDVGDGEPIVIDLEEFDGDTVERLTECLGVPAFDFSLDARGWEPGDGPFRDGPLGGLDELFEHDGDLADLFDDFSFDFDIEGGESGGFGEFGVFDADGSVTITGPDGVSVVELGESGSVTVTRDGDDVTITTDGDATVTELSDLFGDFGALFESTPFDDGSFDEFIESLPAFDELPEFEPIDPEAVQSCIDDVLGR